MNAMDQKWCAVCGRTIEYRARWARDWASVRYCSRRCRGRRIWMTDTRLEEAVVQLLDARARSASICPSEAARRVRPDDWEEWMERTREAGRRLAVTGIVEFTQNGRRVDPSRARGALRIRRGGRWEQRDA